MFLPLTIATIGQAHRRSTPTPPVSRPTYPLVHRRQTIVVTGNLSSSPLSAQVRPPPPTPLLIGLKFPPSHSTPAVVTRQFASGGHCTTALSTDRSTALRQVRFLLTYQPIVTPTKPPPSAVTAHSQMLHQPVARGRRWCVPRRSQLFSSPALLTPPQPSLHRQAGPSVTTLRAWCVPTKPLTRLPPSTPAPSPSTAPQPTSAG